MGQCCSTPRRPSGASSTPRVRDQPARPPTPAPPCTPNTSTRRRHNAGVGRSLGTGQGGIELTRRNQNEVSPSPTPRARVGTRTSPASSASNTDSSDPRAELSQDQERILIENTVAAFGQLSGPDLQTIQPGQFGDDRIGMGLGLEGDFAFNSIDSTIASHNQRPVRVRTSRSGHGRSASDQTSASQQESLRLVGRPSDYSTVNFVIPEGESAGGGSVTPGAARRRATVSSGRTPQR